jgi:fimbrial chaperone protein
MQCSTVFRLKARIKATSVALMLFAAIQPLPASAAEFSVYPISMQFEPGARAAVVGVTNSEKRPLRFQISLVEWTQDAAGVDVYVPSDDLIFFPRQLTIPPGEKNIVRVGPKHKASGPEKTYRLRVEELAEAHPEDTVSTLRMTITFAIPVFLGALEAKPQLTLEPLKLQGGKLTATLKNTGNARFRITSLDLAGADGYTQQAAGWYLLTGASRQYTMDIPPDICRAQKHLNLTVKVGEQDFPTGLDIDPSMCGA